MADGVASSTSSPARSRSASSPRGWASASRRPRSRVADLERRGYVRREADPADGRTRRAALTARGEAAIAAGRATAPRSRPSSRAPGRGARRGRGARARRARASAARPAVRAADGPRSRGGASYGHGRLHEAQLEAGRRGHGVKFGMAPDIEARYARKPLGLENSGVSYFRLAPGFRVPFGHTHAEQEEVYVVISGSAPRQGRRRHRGARRVRRDPRPRRDPARHGGGPRRRGDPRHRRPQHRQQGRGDAAGLLAEGGARPRAQLRAAPRARPRRASSATPSGSRGDGAVGVDDERRALDAAERRPYIDFSAQTP